MGHCDSRENKRFTHESVCVFGLDLVSGTNLTYGLTSVKIGAGKGLRAGGHVRADPKTDVSLLEGGPRSNFEYK